MQTQFCSATPPIVAEQYLSRRRQSGPRSRADFRSPQADPSAGAAAYHARQMAAHGDISHQFPGEPELLHARRPPAPTSRSSPRTSPKPPSQLIHDLWMNSEGHRDNLLDPNVDVSRHLRRLSATTSSTPSKTSPNTVESLSFDQQESTVSRLLAPSGIRHS